MNVSLRTAVLAALIGTSSVEAGFAAKAPAKKVVRKAPAKKAAPAAARAPAPAPVSGRIQNDIGVTPPLGFFDPLNLAARGPEVYRRSQEMEIKHGRLAMAGCLGVIVTEAGIRLPGTPSPSNYASYQDIPGTLDGAYFGTPLLGWIQIMALIAAMDIAIFRQDPRNAPGDVVQDLNIKWVRYSDPAVKTFKLNAERNNGRAAMFGIMGMISHAALGEDALFPLVSSA